MNDYSNNGSLAKVREFNHSQKKHFYSGMGSGLDKWSMKPKTAIFHRFLTTIPWTTMLGC